MMSHIREMGKIGSSDFGNIVIVRGMVQKISWSSCPPLFLDDIVGWISRRLLTSRKKEITIMRSYSLLLEDESGEVWYRGLKGTHDRDAICAGEGIIACGVVKISGTEPYLSFLKKKTFPSFIVRPSRLTRESVRGEKEKAFFATLKKNFPEIFRWPDIADLVK